MIAILDTNVWLDWLVFNDPDCRLLEQVACAAPAQGIHAPAAIDLPVCTRMRDELCDVIARPRFRLSAEQQAAIIGRFDACTRLVASPPALTPLRCTDPDDQVFLDLAVAESATWLVTHDRALLSLARKAERLHRFVIRSPRSNAWQLALAAEPTISAA